MPLMSCVNPAGLHGDKSMCPKMYLNLVQHTGQKLQRPQEQVTPRLVGMPRSNLIQAGADHARLPPSSTVHFLSGGGTHWGLAAAFALLSWPWSRPLGRLGAVLLLQPWALKEGTCWISALLLQGRQQPWVLHASAAGFGLLWCMA